MLNRLQVLSGLIVTGQTQQGFWGSAKAGDEPMGGFDRLNITRPCCNHFRNLAGALPVLLDVAWFLYSSEIPGDIEPMADPVIT
jgi:hypothetical protein